MKWLVQEFLDKNAINSNRIITALERYKEPYLLVRVNENNTLTIIDKDTKLPLDTSEIVLKNFITNEKVTIYGSKALAKIAANTGITPGSFMNNNFEFEVIKNTLGEELLNNDSTIGYLKDLKPIANKFFIRPSGNTKLINGQVISKEDFLTLQLNERSFESPYHSEKIMLSPLKTILMEYRFFVVNDSIITYSSYTPGVLTSESDIIPDSLLAYTKKIIKLFPIAKAYVVDVALTPNGYKVIEYNNINTSGLYNCNEFKIVKAFIGLE